MKKRSKRYKDLVKNSKDKSKLKLNDIIERLKKMQIQNLKSS